MRVDEVFKQAASQGTAPVSFEMFPPKGELTLDTARKVAGNLCKLSPSFVSVTCSAGGSGNGATTAPIAHMITNEFDTPSVAHLTCVGRSHADIAAKIDEYRTAGVENILALRGDLPAGATEDDKPASDYAYARDLIPELVDAGFCVGAAAYPEGHIACEDLNLSVEHLKQKQDAGASFFVTQLFFDNECFYHFRELADKAGITVPITAGIMPFMGKSQISRMVFMCGASLPSPVIKILAKYENCLLYTSRDGGADSAKVVLLELLALAGSSTKEGAAGDDQVLALAVGILLDQEVLLLVAHGRNDLLGGLAKQRQNALGLTRERGHGAQQRGLLVQCLAGVGAERGGDAQRVVLYESVAGGVPGGVAAGLGGGAQAAGGEGGSIRLALDELLAGELHDGGTIRLGADKAVVLLTCLLYTSGSRRR